MFIKMDIWDVHFNELIQDSVILCIIIYIIYIYNIYTFITFIFISILPIKLLNKSARYNKFGLDMRHNAGVYSDPLPEYHNQTRENPARK